MFYDTKLNNHNLLHDPFLCCVVPRPIGWFTTLSTDGIVNLSPYSFFNGIAMDPPQVMIGAGSQHVEGGITDCQKNIEETGEFVANFVTWELRDQMNLTSLHVKRDVSESKMADLELAPSNLIAPPRVVASPIHLECRYLQTIALKANEPPQHPGNPYFLILGEVIGVHLSDDILTDGMVDWKKLKPLARMGYLDYAVIENVFTLPFPDWPEYVEGRSESWSSSYKDLKESQLERKS